MHKPAHDRFGTLQADTSRYITDLGPSRQTQIDKQAHNRFKTLKADTDRHGVKTSTNRLDPDLGLIFRTGN